MANNRLSRQGTIMLNLPGLGIPKPEDSNTNPPPPPYQAAAPAAASAPPPAPAAPVARAPAGAPAAGAPADGSEEPEFGDVEHIATSTVDVTLGGRAATLFVDRFHIAGSSSTSQVRPPPPPAVPTVATEAKSLDFCAYRLDLISAELVNAAVGWAGRPDIQAVWIRLTADDRQCVSCDAAFLADSTVLTPYEIHTGVAKQKELFKALMRPWLDHIVLTGTVGIDYPGDVVFRNALASGGTMNLVGIDWSPHTFKDPGRRRPWIDALKAHMAATLGPAGHLGLFAREIAAADRPAVAAPAGMGQPPLVFKAMAGEPLDAHTSAFLQRAAATLRGIVDEIMAWPATLGRIDMLTVCLLHIRGKGSTVRVDLTDRSATLISDPPSAPHVHPDGLQEKVARRWADLCRLGVPEFDHPAMIAIAASPKGATTLAEVSTKVVWREATMLAPQRGFVGRTYGTRPGDDVERPRTASASPTASAASPLPSNPVANSPRASIVSSPPPVSPPVASPPLVNSMAGLSLASPPLPNVASPVMASPAMASPPPPLTPAPPPSWTGGTLPPFRYQGIGGLILDEPTTSFLTRAKADIGAMLAYIIDWPPTMRQIELISVVLVHIQGRGASARVELTHVMGNNITMWTSLAYSNWGLLQQVVAQRWAELCRRGTPGVDHPEMLALTATPKNTQTINVVSAAACWQYAAEELASSVERTYAQRAGIPVDASAAPPAPASHPAPVRAATAPVPAAAPAPARAPVRAPTAPAPVPAIPPAPSLTSPATTAAALRSSTATARAPASPTSPSAAAVAAGTSLVSPTVSFLGIPGEVLPERTRSFLQRRGPQLLDAMREIMTWPPTLGRIDEIHVYLVHMRGRGATVNLQLFAASGAEITQSTVGDQNARVLHDRVAGHWAAICRTGHPEIDHPPMLVLVATPATGVLREVATRAVWVEAALPEAARVAVAQHYAARPGDNVDRRASGPPQGSYYLPPSADQRTGLSVLALRNADGRPELTAAFVNSFSAQALKMIDLALSWPPRHRHVRGAILMLVQSEGRRASIALVDGANGEKLEVGESGTGQPPTVLQNRIGQLWAEECARGQAGTHHPPVVFLTTLGDVNPASPVFDISALWTDQECLRLVGRTIPELYEDISAYTPGRAGPPLGTPHTRLRTLLDA